VAELEGEDEDEDEVTFEEMEEVGGANAEEGTDMVVEEEEEEPARNEEKEDEGMGNSNDLAAIRAWSGLGKSLFRRD